MQCQPTNSGYGQAMGPHHTRSGHGAFENPGLSANSNVMLKRKIVKVTIPPRSGSPGCSTRGVQQGHFAGGMTRAPPPGHFAGGSAQGHPSGHFAGGMTQGPPPGHFAGGNAQGHPSGHFAGGMTQGPPPGHFAGGNAQGHCVGGAGGMTRGPPSGHFAGGMAQGYPSGHGVGGAGGMTRGPPPGHFAGGTAQEHCVGGAGGMFQGPPGGHSAAPGATRGAFTDYVHKAEGAVHDAFQHIPEYAGKAEGALENLIGSIAGGGVLQKLEQMINMLFNNTKINDLLEPVIKDIEGLPDDPVDAVHAGCDIVRKRLDDLEHLLSEKAKTVINH